MKKKREPVDYGSYLGLEKILDSQDRKSAEFGEPAHDETLFIIIHQTYELWFKQILHELESVLQMFQNDFVDEKRIGVAVSRLNRVVEIQKVLIDQIRILETMTPLDFLEFRNYLTPASGFQSLQFRILEIKLGLETDNRIRYSKQAYHQMFADKDRELLMTAEAQPSLFLLLQQWLERIPFLDMDEFNFADVYRGAVETLLKQEREAITDADLPKEEEEQRLQMMNATEKHFHSIFDPEKHNLLIAEGRRRLSYKATMAGLLIHLYRDQPILHLPFRLLNLIVDMDELLSTWRYRHALMVLRMIGRKTGTGGSSGYSYLKSTAESHRVFADLFNLSTFLVPRSLLPKLPENVERNLGFYFSANDAK
ncbi:MAG: tryptophan 2,3-dioxygenase family protein [Calditrichia bacterium]